MLAILVCVSVYWGLQTDGHAAAGGLASAAPTAQHSARLSSGGAGCGSTAAHPRHDGLPRHATVPGIPTLRLHLQLSSAICPPG